MPTTSPDLDFAFSYPAYIVLIDQHKPQYALMGDAFCLCVFTDKDLAERYIEKFYPPEKLPKDIEYISHAGPRELLQSLVRNASELAKDRVQHLAIDVTPGKASLQLLISEVIDRLEYDATQGTYFDFAFPSYFVLNSQQSPHCVIAGEESCVCLFTDRDLALQYVEDTYAPGAVPKGIVYVSVPDRRDLLNKLVQIEAVFVIHRLAIDVTSGKRCLTLSMPDVIERLTQQIGDDK
jgi:hypothetical protein